MTLSITNKRVGPRSKPIRCLTCYELISPRESYSVLEFFGAESVAHYSQESKCHYWMSEKAKKLSQAQVDFHKKQKQEIWS